MEDLRSSRRQARPPPPPSSYADVFGGGPKHSAAAKSDDYAEIFGEIAGACSIPFLDLPPPPAECGGDGGGFVDYEEIFGGCRGGGFAVDYEEMFGGSRKGAGFSSGRVQPDMNSGEQTKVSDIAPEVSNKNFRDFPVNNMFSSSSRNSGNSWKQFSTLYHRTSHGNMEDEIGGKTHVTELHAVPGYANVINPCSSEDASSNCPLNVQTSDHDAPKKNHMGRSSDGEREAIVPPNSSTNNTVIDGTGLRMNQNGVSIKHAALEDDPGSTKHHSRSSSSHSASSGDINYPSVTYIGIADINLQTKPFGGPPPSRTPPKIDIKQENTKMSSYRNSKGDEEEGHILKHPPSRQIRYKVGTAKSNGMQGVPKDSSARFFDVEVDVSSAAAASAAAMKEAMEQAQARLRSAKELLEKKRDNNLQSRKKLAHKGHGNHEETKEVKGAAEETLFCKGTAKELLGKAEKETEDYVSVDMCKVKKVGKSDRDHEERERYIVTAEEKRNKWPGYEFEIPQMRHIPDVVSAEWKTEEQFYELINNEKFGAEKEASTQEVIGKKPKTSREVNEDKEDYSEKGEVLSKFRTVSTCEVSETINKDEIDENLRTGDMASKEVSGKKPDKISEKCVLKENKAEDTLAFHHLVGNGKFQIGQEALIDRQKPEIQNSDEDASSREHGMGVKSSCNASILETYHENEEYITVQAGKMTCEYDGEEGLSESYMTSASHECESQEIYIDASQQDNGTTFEVTSGTCSVRPEAKSVAVEEGHLYENSEFASGSGMREPCNEDIACKLEGAASTSKHVESQELNGLQGACTTAMDDLKGTQDEHLVEEVAQEVEPGLESVEMGVTEEKMNSAQETCWQNSTGTKPIEYQPSLQQNEKLHMDQSPSDDSVRDGELKEGNVIVTPASQENHNQPDAAQVVRQSATNTDKGDHEQGSGVKSEDPRDAFQEVSQKPGSSCDVMYARGTLGTENFKPDLHKKEKLADVKKTERERDCEKDHARKLEEEREREREREKDRLAVERATREAHERALADARERAERIAVERATAEARQRALAESREKAAAAALEKSLAEKALKEARLRAERAAVERATAEARERAVEKALADKAAADARQRAERLGAISRDKEDRDIKIKASSNHGEVESPLRSKARLERHQRTVERAAKALAEKNMRDIFAQREQAERNRLSESLDADVKRWSTGKEGNLRALLSTLQYILGPDSGWQPIPLTDVITAAAVKKAYRKATLCVHPDKLQQRGASIQQKYICEKVFDLLKEAWNRFNSEER